MPAEALGRLQALDNEIQRVQALLVRALNRERESHDLQQALLVLLEARRVLLLQIDAAKGHK